MIKTSSCLWFRGSVPAFSVWSFEMSEMRKVLGIVFFVIHPLFSNTFTKTEKTQPQKSQKFTVFVNVLENKV